ncbi:hypothetical protein [Streptococcus pneumoniae]|uniref:hypothetical protein n=1 Tax=Streptococcus pneumoniae TaxID=1313 RepID=UPI0015DA7ED2|nr:hypothetical protein [Streptococcus pneumoniae]
MSTDETLYTLRKSLQTSSASPCRMYGSDLVSSIYNLQNSTSALSTTSKQCFEPSTTSKQCFEHPASSFLVIYNLKAVL